MSSYIDPLPFSGYSLKPEMGLPVELWLYLIEFLAHRPSSLFVLSLTCKNLSWHARSMLDDLKRRSIDLTSYSNVTRFVDDLRDAPKFAPLIYQLSLQGHRAQDGVPAVAFSLIPHQVTPLLVGLQDLALNHLYDLNQTHPSTWRLFGRTLPSVTTVWLQFICFPSFADFCCLITSFISLTELLLNGITCLNISVPPIVARPENLHKPKLQLNQLTLMQMTSRDCQNFFSSFAQWFLRSGFQVPGTIRIGTDVKPHLPLMKMILGIGERLQTLHMEYRYTWCVGDELRKYAGKRHPSQSSCPTVNQDPLAILRLHLPNLREIHLTECSHEAVALIEFIRTVLAHRRAPLPNMRVTIRKESLKLHSSAWNVIDVLFCAAYTFSRLRNHSQAQLIIDLEENQKHAEMLLPLCSSLGKDRWFTTEGSVEDVGEATTASGIDRDNDAPPNTN
ncbi:hypothetical protein NLI96_g3278 [Meripilus lineatus]|uniref:Uncharacterized protein n=1 Tax=Meripilus lineatus TaxID=2056292 RepID=A0AAD5V720_9APHY|nr:hypothetical protein NLI96_g3278 [Physisporinus lineatus]